MLYARHGGSLRVNASVVPNSPAALPFPSYRAIFGDCIGGRAMKLYRVNKLAKRDGAVIKKKNILASSDRDAVKQAQESPDCPICDVLRDGQTVGEIL